MFDHRVKPLTSNDRRNVRNYRNENRNDQRLRT